MFCKHAKLELWEAVQELWALLGPGTAGVSSASSDTPGFVVQERPEGTPGSHGCPSGLFLWGGCPADAHPQGVLMVCVWGASWGCGSRSSA